MDCYKNKVAIVTGGASGVGLALCQELALYGATVTVADIQLEKAEQVASAICASGGKAFAAFVDVAQEDQVLKLVETVVLRDGQLDYMFNNAGIGIIGEVRDMTTEQWKKIIDVNLLGVINGISAAYPIMIKQRSGHIVNTSSGFGLFAMPTHVPYATTKHAIVGLSTGLRQEAEGLGVKVTVACLGIIKTPMSEASTYLKVKREEMQAKPPFKLMEPDDCARSILNGVARNKAIFTIPFNMTLLWWLHRISPALTAKGGKMMLQSFRKVRDKYD